MLGIRGIRTRLALMTAVLLLASAALMLGGASAVASPGWSEPVNISSGTITQNNGPQIAVDGQGGTHVIWKGKVGTVWNLYYSENLGSGWSAPVIVSTGTDEEPGDYRMVLGPDSRPHVVWYEYSVSSMHIFYSTLGEEGWTAPANLSSAGPSVDNAAPDIAVDGDGAYVVFKGTYTAQIRTYFTRDIGEGWSVPLDLSLGTTDNQHPRIGVDSTGYLHVVWYGSDGSPRVFYSTATATSFWTGPVSISGTVIGSTLLSLAVDDLDGLHVMWEVTSSPSGVYYVANPGTGWSAPVNVAAGMASFEYSQMAVDPAGHPHIVWTGNDGTNRGTLYTTNPGSGWTTPLNLDPSSYNNYMPKIAVGDDGYPQVVWVWANGTGELDIWYSANRGGGWSAPLMLSECSESYPMIAVDPLGNPHVAWDGIGGGPGFLDGIFYTEEIYNGAPWYLAEGCTDGGMETFVLVQNPNPDNVTVDVTFMTGSGMVSPEALNDVIVPADSRVTFKANDYVTDFDVSTKVVPTGGNVICERSVYGNERTWAHDSIGVTTPSYTWFLAEGSTNGGMETFVLVQNPNATDALVELNFMTGAGVVPGPQNVTVKAGSRVTFKANDYVTDYNVSTVVSGSFPVIAERSVYGNGRTWAHDSIGVTVPSDLWFLAEGSTDGGMETFVLVQNPYSSATQVDLDFMTGAGVIPGPQDVTIPAYSRVTFKVNDYVTDYNVSTAVSGSSPVVAERSVYGNDRAWAHDSIGTSVTASEWFLAEGSTDGGMETFVLVQNPNGSAVTVDLGFMTGSGYVAGPQDVNIPAYSRVTFKVNDYVTDYNVSTKVTSTGGGIICERSMYGNGRTWATDSIGYPR
jgi:hypothetical protein